MKSDNSLHVTNLSCMRQQRPVFSNISFQVDSGELLVVEGPNGSGKSSLLRLLTGLSTQNGGEIFWQGKSLIEIHEEYQANLHYLAHANGIKTHLTVAENLKLVLCLSQASARMGEVLESLQLTIYKNTFANHLSAGQKRRLALARILLVDRKIWILDEPLTALDKRTQEFFLSSLENHLQHDGIAVISSHHPISFNNIVVKNLSLGTC